MKIHIRNLKTVKIKCKLYELLKLGTNVSMCGVAIQRIYVWSSRILMYGFAMCVTYRQI